MTFIHCEVEGVRKSVLVDGVEETVSVATDLVSCVCDLLVDQDSVWEDDACLCCIKSLAGVDGECTFVAVGQLDFVLMATMCSWFDEEFPLVQCAVLL